MGRTAHGAARGCDRDRGSARGPAVQSARRFRLCSRSPPATAAGAGLITARARGTVSANMPRWCGATAAVRARDPPSPSPGALAAVRDGPHKDSCCVRVPPVDHGVITDPGTPACPAAAAADRMPCSCPERPEPVPVRCPFQLFLSLAIALWCVFLLDVLFDCLLDVFSLQFLFLTQRESAPHHIAPLVRRRPPTFVSSRPDGPIQYPPPIMQTHRGRKAQPLAHGFVFTPFSLSKHYPVYPRASVPMTHSPPMQLTIDN